jgi:hypothetical protein
MIYCEDETPEVSFGYHLQNIPHIDGETGERVRSGIAMLFEEAHGVPTQASVDIDELPLPPTKGILE